MPKKTVGDLLDYINKLNIPRNMEIQIGVAQHDEDGTYDGLSLADELDFEVEEIEYSVPKVLMIMDSNDADR